MPQRTAFDHALELHELRYATEVYASRHGAPGSAAYRTAWFRFRKHVASIEDPQRVRAVAARRKSPVFTGHSPAPARKPPAPTQMPPEPAAPSAVHARDVRVPLAGRAALTQELA